MKINIGRPILYVEPNDVNATDVSGEPGGYEMERHIIPPEDYCIYVDLRAEVYGRGMGTSENPSRKTYILQWRSDSDKSTVSFMSGTKIHLEGKSGATVNSLTTKFTETYLDDVIQTEGTSEMFGISSIDVSYNQFLAPEITINFVDIRGVGLFAKSQHAHQAAKDGIGGFRDEDIADSFFNCFFMNPYPDFEIVIKGFYGEAITYKLNCTSFNTNFESSTGNFNATAKFIGYAYSFLNDVSFNALLSAPYSDAGGIEYWKSRSTQYEDDFFVYGLNGDKRPIPTLADVLVSMDNIEDKLKSELEGSQAIQTQSELEDKKISLGTLISKNEAYIGAWKDSFNDDEHMIIGGNNRDMLIMFKNDPPEGKYYMLTEKTAQKIQEARDEVINYAKELGIKPHYDETKKVSELNSSQLINYNTETKKYSVNKHLGELVKIVGHENNSVEQDVLTELATNERFKDGYYKHGFYVVNSIVEYTEDLNSMLASIEEDINGNQSAVEQAHVDAMTNILGFIPTVYNFCKIIFAHLETYMHLFYLTCGKIYSTPDIRKASNLNMTDVNFMSDFKIREGGDETVPPFPLVNSRTVEKVSTITEDTSMDATQNTQGAVTIDNNDGTKTIIEEDWVGNVSPMFEEINFINGLLNGAKVIGEYLEMHGISQSESESNTAPNGVTGRKCAVNRPLCAGDTVLRSSDAFGPWGKIDFSDYSDFCGKVFIRMMQTIAYTQFTNIPGTFGRIDSQNFLDKFKPSGIVLDKINGEHGFDEFLSIIFGEDSNYKRDGRFAWEGSSTGSYGIASGNKDLFGLNITNTSGGKTILPFEGVSFSQIREELRSTNENPPRCTVPADMSNYALFDDFAIKGKTKAQNKNVFFVDSHGYGDYAEFFNWTNELEQKEKDYIEHLTAFDCEFSNDIYLEEFYDINKFKEFFTFLDTSSVSSFVDSGKLRKIPAVKEGNMAPTDDGCVFLSKLYCRQANMASKAYIFLNALCGFLRNGKDHIFDYIYDRIVNNGDSFRIVPNFVLLLLGAEIYMAKGGSSSFIGKLELWKGALSVTYRSEIVDMLIARFQNWASNEFVSIDSLYCPGVTGEFFSLTGKLKEGELQKYIVQPESFKTIYDGGDIDYNSGTESFKAQFKQDIDFKELNNSIIGPAIMVISCHKRESMAGIDRISRSCAKEYWDAFMEGLKGSSQNVNASGNTSTGETVANMSEAPEDLKVALYHHCKAFFDKWLSGSNLDDFERKWKLSNYFDPKDNRNGRFHFIDSFYNDVSNRVIVNPQIIIEDIENSTSINGYNLFSILSDILSKNRFMFYCPENFKNLMNQEMFDKTFKPVPYTQMTINEESADFVALYSYEPSSKLDIADANFPGDSFMLDHEILAPYAVTNKNMDFDYPLPAFAVTYGMQYQSYFTDIEVGMEKPQATEQSLKTQYLLAGAANDTTLTRQYVPYGQDLYQIYSNNAYTCTVKMMGCAWIQPLMYFCLTNVPMFRGSYLISSVRHSITPGNIETTFVGTRMANTATRLATNWIKKGYAAQEFYEEHKFNRYGPYSGGDFPPYENNPEEPDVENRCESDECETEYNEEQTNDNNQQQPQQQDKEQNKEPEKQEEKPKEKPKQTQKEKKKEQSKKKEEKKQEKKKNNGKKDNECVVTTPADLKGTVRQKIIQLCEYYLKKKIRTGGSTVNSWYKQAGITTKGGGWCALFVYNVLKEAGATTLCDMVKSGRGAPPTYKRFLKPTSNPSPGDILITDSDKSIKEGGQGRHIGFIVAVDGNNITEIGGNQSKTVTRWHGTYNGTSAKLKEDRRKYTMYRSDTY